MTALDQKIDVTKNAEIRQVRRVASAILAALTCVFAASFVVAEPPYWLLLVRAMAEAGMVGGLADWFAVEALFRHPLKLPIPHTALLPKNQQRAAGNIARFIDGYFLVPEQLLAQVDKINPVRLLAEWMRQRSNAETVARELSQLLHLVIKSQLHGGVDAKTAELVRDILMNSVDARDLSNRISQLLKGTVDSQLLDEILQEVHKVLDQKRDRVTEIVQDRSRWWIATTVDKQIVKFLVDGVLSIIDELSDRDSSLRQDFDGAVVQMIERFQSDGRIAQFVDESQRRYADSEAFKEAVGEIMAKLFAQTERTLSEHPERVAEHLAGAVEQFAQTILDDPALAAQLNQRLQSGLIAVLDEIRPAIMHYITQVIAEWDSDELVERMENEVGRDLQFIRINGAVLGAFVGGTLFLITSAIH